MVDTTESEPLPSEYAWKVMRSIVISLDTIATIVNLACLTFLFWFRKKPIVAMGQYRLLAVMCVGSLVYMVGNMLEHIYWNFYLPEFEFSEKYMTTCWSLGDFAVDVILFLKLYRVYKVTRFRRNQTVLARHIIVPFLVCLIPPLVFGILYRYRNFKDVYFWLWQVSLWLLRIALVVFAWKLRNVEESVGDTRKILRYGVFEIIIWSFLWLSFACKFGKKFLEAKGYSDASWIISLLVFGLLPFFLHSVAPAIFLVFPRMYLVWYERVHGHLPDHVQVYGAGNVHVNADLNTRPGAANANANAGTTTTETTTATVSQAEASVENPAATTTTTETVGGTGNENTTVAKNVEDGRDGGSSRQQSTNDDDDDDNDDSGGGAAAAVANV